MPEIQKNVTTRPRYDAPDMSKMVARSSVAGDTYTCPVCSQQVKGLMQYQMHLTEAHGCRNKEPMHA